MRRRRATHMAAVEEEVERLSQENSLLLHRLSQLVASHQVVDAENQQLRSELLALRQSVVSGRGAVLGSAAMSLQNEQEVGKLHAADQHGTLRMHKGQHHPTYEASCMSAAAV